MRIVESTAPLPGDDPKTPRVVEVVAPARYRVGWIEHWPGHVGVELFIHGARHWIEAETIENFVIKLLSLF